MNNKIINTMLIIILVAILLLTGCTEKGEPIDPFFVPDFELSGEIVIALDFRIRPNHGTAHGVGVYNYNIPNEKSSFYPIHAKLLEFMDLHPKVTIKVKTVTWDTQWATRSSMSGGDVSFEEIPDIFELTPHQARWEASGQLEELTFYMQNLSGGKPLGKEYMSLMDKSMIDGRYYLLPVRSDPMVVYYSEHYFDLFDLDAPADDWTWSDFIATVSGIPRGDSLLRIFKELDNIEHVINAFGGKFISPDHEQFEGYVNSEETEEAFSNYFELIDPFFRNLGTYPEPGRGSNTISGPLDGSSMEEGPALGMTRASHMLVLLEAEALRYRMAPMPVTENNRYENTIHTSGLAMNNQSENKELAWELMRFIVGEDEEEQMDFVASNTLIGLSERYLDLPRYEELKNHLRIESADSQLSSVYFVPTYVWGYTDQHIREDQSRLVAYDENTTTLSSYLRGVASYLEHIRDAMIERKYYIWQNGVY